MKEHASVFSLDQMASILGVSRSGYYDFMRRKPSPRFFENATLLEQIKTIYKDSLNTYGSPRIHAELKERGITCSRQRVAKIMKNHNIQAKMHKKFRRTTKRSDHLNFKPQDLLKQNFNVHHPNTVWVADMTYLSVNKKWAYLAVVLDLFSRKIVGMALADHMKTDLILAALQQALTLRSPPYGLIHHSDLGSQYTSHGLQKLAKHYDIFLSYGRSAYDNAVMESFFHTLNAFQNLPNS